MLGGKSPAAVSLATFLPFSNRRWNMKHLLPSLLFSLCLLPLVGCGQSNEPQAVTTDEDEIAAYEAALEGEETPDVTQ